MGRKRELLCGILTAISVLTSCNRFTETAEVSFMLSEPAPTTKAVMPDEEKISDVSFLIFDSYGRLEYSSYTTGSSYCQTRLLVGERYYVRALVNFGYKIEVQSIKDLENLVFHLAYPDEYKSGIPMSASSEVIISGNAAIELEPVRLMSRISIRMDRSRLSENVTMDVSSIRIGNCPRKANVFSKSKAESEDDCFRTGFSHNGPECSPLNTENSGRMSDEVSLYMLENMQGSFSEDKLESDEDKVFEEYDRRNETCSYIEIGLEYSSPEWETSEKPLLYRFYLGEDRNNLDVERNCHYHITVRPEDDGLNGNSWRVDKTGLKYTGETSLVKYPSDYIRGNIGDTVHLGCILTPSHTPFDVGIEYMEDDKAEGIYDYTIDADGHGATLLLTGPGAGLIYMEAGDPINEAALFIIEVNQP